MNNKENHHGGNGFIFGVIVGVAIALLFTTKRGRKVLRVMTDKAEKGFKEKVSEVEEVLEEELEGNDFVANMEVEPEVTQTPAPKPTHHAPVAKPSIGKRFFKKKA